jgi:hypothetical protein
MEKIKTGFVKTLMNNRWNVRYIVVIVVKLTRIDTFYILTVQIITITFLESDIKEHDKPQYLSVDPKCLMF